MGTGVSLLEQGGKRSGGFAEGSAGDPVGSRGDRDGFGMDPG